MTNVIDLIAFEISLAKSEMDAMECFAWYDTRSTAWRSCKRNSQGRYPIIRGAWPMTWDIVNGVRHQFAFFSPGTEVMLKRVGGWEA
jgi:hypothetical protein